MSLGVALSALPGDAETHSGTHPHMHTSRGKLLIGSRCLKMKFRFSPPAEHNVQRFACVNESVFPPLMLSEYFTILRDPSFHPCKISVAQKSRSLPTYICLIFQYLTLLCSTFMFFLVFGRLLSVPQSR